MESFLIWRDDESTDTTEKEKEKKAK